jgi:hypothetical protein
LSTAQFWKILLFRRCKFVLEFGGNIYIPYDIFWLRVDHNLVQWLHAICNRKDETIGKASFVLLPYILPHPKIFSPRCDGLCYILSGMVLLSYINHFYLIWLPGMFLIVIGAAKSVYREKWMCIGYLFCGLQPIVSTCMAMTKSDVRKYTRDLITLSYARKVRD